MHGFDTVINQPKAFVNLGDFFALCAFNGFLKMLEENAIDFGEGEYVAVEVVHKYFHAHLTVGVDKSKPLGKFSLSGEM